jgi:hypothetical protein
MVFQGCSDVVESRVEHLFSTPNAAGMQLLLRIRNSPGALALRARGLLTTTRYDERALSIDEFDDLSIERVGAVARFCL